MARAGAPASTLTAEAICLCQGESGIADFKKSSGGYLAGTQSQIFHGPHSHIHSHLLLSL